MEQVGDPQRVEPLATTGAIRRFSNDDVFVFAALLFLAPNILFAASALRPAPAATVLAGSAGVVYFLWRARSVGPFLSAALDPRKLGYCLATAFALCILGGEGHFFHANWDWLVRDAVLSDLVNHGVTPFYRYEGQDYYLRTPLGMYLLPATVGRVFGLFAAHLALLTTNSALLGSMLYLASGLATARILIFAPILIAFSGLDVIGDLAARALSLRGGDLSNQTLEWWALAFAPDVVLQYSSMLTQIFWSPNHALPGWFIGILVLLQGRGEITLSVLIVCCATLVIWSPLPVIGALPLAAALTMRLPWRKNISVENLLAVGAGLSFLPVAFYLVMDNVSGAHGLQTAARGFAWIYIPFLLIEAPQAAILLNCWRRIAPTDRASLIAALASLCLFPLYEFGPSNDLAMRGSIPALFLVAFAFAEIAASTRRDGGVLATIISGIILISAATPMTQIKHALTAGRFSLSDCNILTAWQSTSPIGFATNYLARVEKFPDWLIATDPRQMPTQIEYRLCWPDHPAGDLLRGDASR